MTKSEMILHTPEEIKAFFEAYRWGRKCHICAAVLVGAEKEVCFGKCRGDRQPWLKKNGRQSGKKVHSISLPFSFGTFTHLILDEMWRTPQTLLWPFYGITFNRVDIEEWLPNIFEALITSPATYLPELVGAVILMWFAITLLYQRKVLSFLKSGHLH